MIPVQKKDGSKRICVDYRELNSVVETEPFPMPNIDGITPRLASARIFSAINLKAGYWQISIDESLK